MAFFRSWRKFKKVLRIFETFRMFSLEINPLSIKSINGMKNTFLEVHSGLFLIILLERPIQHHNVHKIKDKYLRKSPDSLFSVENFFRKENFHFSSRRFFPFLDTAHDAQSSSL